MAQFELNGVVLEIPDALLTMSIRRKLTAGKYEQLEARAAQLAIDHGDHVLDLGSGVGYIATLCAMLAGAENVVTVEANPALLPVIRTNLDANGCSETQTIHAAVVGQDADQDTLSFQPARAFWASSIAEDDTAQSIKVPAVGIRDLLETHRPTVVMLDIEGAEAGMFASPWPAHVRVVMMELHPKRYPDDAIKQIFDGMSASGLIYAPGISRGAFVGFCRAGQALDGTDD